MDEIGRDEHIKEEQAFYGEMAFNDWLSSRGLKPQPPAKPAEVKSSKKSKSSIISSDKSEAAPPPRAQRDSIMKANSRRRQTFAGSPVAEEHDLQDLRRHHSVGLISFILSFIKIKLSKDVRIQILLHEIFTC